MEHNLAVLIEKMCKALASESRLRILRVLLTGRFSVNELVSILAMGQSRVSRHLKLLYDAGLAEVRREGTWAYYEATANQDNPVAVSLLDLVRSHADGGSDGRQDDSRRLLCLDGRRRQTRAFHDAVASRWSRLRKDLFGNSTLAQHLLAPLQAATVVADLGCGAGELLVELARPDRRVIGVDASPAMIEEARRQISGQSPPAKIELRLGNLEHLPLANAEVDGVLMNMVLHHLAEPVLALEEIRRVLVPGGLLVLCDLTRHDQERMREQYGDLWLGFSEQEIDRFLGQSGFELIQLQHYDAPLAGIMVAEARTAEKES